MKDYYVLSIILELSNKEEKKYVIKQYNTSELRSITMDYCDRILKNEHSLIWVIGLKEVIEKIDEWGSIDSNGYPSTGQEPYHPYAFQHVFTKLINSGDSLIIMTNHSDEYQILPKKGKLKTKVSEKIFKTHPMISDIYCYTYDDELDRAVSILSKYIDAYNSDVKNISIKTIINRINNLEKEQIKLKLTKKL